MGILKKIKNYFKRKSIVRNQLDNSIPNQKDYSNLKKTIVFINGGIPMYDKDSGSNRFNEIIIGFKEQGYNCIICTKNAFRTNPYISFYEKLGIIVYVETIHYNNYFDYLKTIPKVDYIWYYSPNTLQDNLKKVSKIHPNAKSIFDMVDIHFLRYQRAIQLEPNRISLRKKYNKYFKIETVLSQKVDYVVAISNIEKEIMCKYINSNKIITISNIHYPKVDKDSVENFENRKDILFIGSQHTPNIDALYFLYNDIMPLVWKEIPTIKINIIGDVNKTIKDINHPNFIFQGYVQDITAFFASNKLMVAPLRYGAGVKGKIGQAFEYYLPVVTTSIGAEGMELIDSENALINDTKEGFSKAILELYTNKKLWQKLQNNSENSLKPFSRENLKTVIKSL